MGDSEHLQERRRDECRHEGAGAMGAGAVSQGERARGEPESFHLGAQRTGVVDGRLSRM